MGMGSELLTHSHRKPEGLTALGSDKEAWLREEARTLETQKQ